MESLVRPHCISCRLIDGLRMWLIVLANAALTCITNAGAQSPEPAAPTTSVAATPAATPTEPLHVAIDRLLVSRLPHLTAARAAEGQLLRRLSLDLRGVVPTGEELVAFKADPDPNKWPAWIKRFLADPLHQERMVDWLDKTYMHRRPFTNVDRAAWLAWLRDVVEQRVPLNTFVSRMLTAPWWENSQRPALRFFLDRSGDPHSVTRDLGRVLLGRDMQCNQCHDHPLVEEYLQIDYHGLFAFVSGSSLVEGTSKDEKGAEKKTKMYVERPGADAPFESVFEKGVALRSGPRLPASAENFEPYLEPDARLQSSAQPNAIVGLPRSPVISRREQLAQELLSKQPRVLARNMANRLWALVFGRGLIHPLDMQHADNPPSHPELLELLAAKLVEMQFDSDQFIEQLVLTSAYGRAAELPIRPWPVAADAPPESAVLELSELTQAATATKEKLSSELTAAKPVDTQSEQALEAARTAWRTAQLTRNAARAELDKAEAAFNDVKKKSDEAHTARDVAVKKHQDTLSRIQLLDEAHAKLAQAIALTVGEDAELKAAITTSKARADAARAEIAALEKAATDSQAAAAAALVLLDAPRAKVKEAAAAHHLQEQTLAPLDAAFAAARQTWSEKHSQVVLLEANIERADRCLAFVQAVSAARAALSERQGVETQLAAQQTQLATLDQQLQAATGAVSAAGQQLVDANVTLAAARQAQAAHEAQLEQLKETVRQLEKAATVVAMAEPLKPAITSINETIAAKSSATAQVVAVTAQAEQTIATVTARIAQLQAAHDTANQARTVQQSAVAAATADRNTRAAKVEELAGKAREAWQTLLTDRQIDLSMASMRPQSPEQLGLSILRVTGILDNYINVELAELQKTQPLPADADAAATTKRQQLALRQAMDKLRPNVDVFASLFASGVGQSADEFFASPDQALYMSNAGPVFAWAGASGQNVTQRVVAQKDNAAACTDLYGTLLARDPSVAELALVNERLTAAGENRSAIAQEMVWAILTGVEFRFYR